MQPLDVLVVDHDPARREAVLELLRGAGHRPLPVEDGPDAAATLGAPGFQALWIDLSLPTLDLAGVRRALAPEDPVTPDSLEAAERRHIALVLRHTAGNKRRAANLLGIARSTLLHKVRKYGLDSQP